MVDGDYYLSFFFSLSVTKDINNSNKLLTQKECFLCDMICILSNYFSTQHLTRLRKQRWYKYHFIQMNLMYHIHKSLNQSFPKNSNNFICNNSIVYTYFFHWLTDIGYTCFLFALFFNDRMLDWMKLPFGSFSFWFSLATHLFARHFDYFCSGVLNGIPIMFHQAANGR